ncbi:MAG: hypothetical protein Q9164_001060 [Protoblastenia rupestris]
MGNILSFLPNSQIDPNSPIDSFEAAEYVFFKRPHDVDTIVVGIMFDIPSPRGQRITPADIAKMLKYRDPQFWTALTPEEVQTFYCEMRNNENHMPSMNPYNYWKLVKRVGENTSQKYTEVVLKLQKDLRAVNRR